MCHAAAWIIHHVSKPPHGEHFQYWANKASKAFSDIKVTVCHNYEINYKYRYQCSNPECNKTLE